jgi:hypothetical protein
MRLLGSCHKQPHDGLHPTIESSNCEKELPSGARQTRILWRWSCFSDPLIFDNSHRLAYSHGSGKKRNSEIREDRNGHRHSAGSGEESNPEVL